MRLDGKVVALTGAGGGLGTAIAKRFAQEGVAALIIADVDEPALTLCRDELRLSYPNVEIDAVIADVRDPDAVDQIAAKGFSRHKRLDVMINNAGVLSPNARIHHLTLDDWRRSVDVNLFGTFNGIKTAVSLMRSLGGGSIINTASVAGMTAWAYTAPYGATKAAIIQLTRIAAVEYADDKIRVNCVCPGAFPSSIFKDSAEGILHPIALRHPLGLGIAEDIVGAFVYLASDDSRWTTGSTLVVDGGYSAP